MQKPYIPCATLNLSKALPKLKALAGASHYVQLEGSTISINDPQRGTINSILKEIRSILRKYNSKNFHKLHLRFYHCSGLTRSALKKLGLEIAASFRDVRELSLEFNSCNIKTKGFIIFLTMIRSVTKYLRKLDLSVIGCRKITDKGIHYLQSWFIPNLKILQRLTLNFYGKTTILDNSDKILFEPNIEKRIIAFSRRSEKYSIQSAISISYKRILTLVGICNKYLRKLQQLVFIPPNINNQNITRSKTQKDMIISMVKSFKRLRKLYLGFQMFQSFTSEDLAEITCRIGRNLKGLQYLALDFHFDFFRFAIADKDLANLALNIFSQIPGLRGFTFSSNDETNISNEGMINFGTLLCQYAQNMEELVLDIKPSLTLTRQGFEGFMENVLNNLAFFKRYTLNILQDKPPQKENQIKIKPLTQLAGQSAQELNLYFNKFNLWTFQLGGKLRILSLLFRDCSEMTNPSLVSLAHNIFRLPLRDLEQFTLICGNSCHISDKAIISLCSQDWTLLTNLKSLTLEFSNSNFITDSAIEHIEASILKNMTYLHTFCLTFSGCDRIKESGIISLVKVIARELRDIKELRLYFNCQSIREAITQNEVNMIMEEISTNLKALKKLLLDFGVRSIRTYSKECIHGY